jgi:hypothetical protein
MKSNTSSRPQYTWGVYYCSGRENGPTTFVKAHTIKEAWLFYMKTIALEGLFGYRWPSSIIRIF